MTTRGRPKATIDAAIAPGDASMTTNDAFVATDDAFVVTNDAVATTQGPFFLLAASFAVFAASSMTSDDAFARLAVAASLPGDAFERPTGAVVRQEVASALRDDAFGLHDDASRGPSDAVVVSRDRGACPRASSKEETGASMRLDASPMTTNDAPARPSAAFVVIA